MTPAPLTATQTAPTRKMRHVRNHPASAELPLFAWVATAKRGGRPRSNSQPPAKHCKTCGTQISRYSRGHCRRCGYLGLKRSCPDDFLGVLHRLGSQGAAKHFNASLSTVTRWRRECGMVLHERARRAPHPGPMFKARQGFLIIDRPQRDMSLAGQAADHLRQFGSVYRCDANGKASPKGTHWRRNNAVLTDAEIMARAERLGWKVEG